MSLLSALMPAVLGNVSFINSLLVSLGVALSSLPATQQNGNSNLGNLPQLVLPAFLGGPGNNAPPSWAGQTAPGSRAFIDMPTTGVTRRYDWHIARGTLSPDGVEKQMILINGQFPGPLLEANWGDFFEVTVHNDITSPEEGTTIHWHGLIQNGTEEQDGVPGVSQCPIAPGSSMTYRFQADSYGTSWYHSHYSGQYTDGAYGPIVIHGPSSAPYDIDLGPVMVADYYHKGYRELLNSVMSTDYIKQSITFADNTLIQGKMKYDCSQAQGRKCNPNAGIAKFQFKTGKTHRMRFINPSSFGIMVVSIDHHTMTVIANDYVPVVPYDTTTVTLAAGQRIDVLVKGRPGLPSLNNAYYLRVRQPPLCALAGNPMAVAAIYYDNGNTNAAPLSLPQLDFITPRLLDCASSPLGQTIPYYPIAMTQPDTTVRIDITQEQNSTGYWLYMMNKSPFMANYNDPVLRDAQAGDLSFVQNPLSNTYNFGKNNTIRIILKNHVPFSHPMHVHGQNMYVLDSGVGEWDGKTITRPSNPQRRDTQILLPNGYIVVQLVSDNPGVWPFHCHFTWHVSQGLYFNVLQRPDLIKTKTAIPGVVDPVCDAWQQYTNKNIVDQIDSGVKFRERFREKEKRED